MKISLYNSIEKDENNSVNGIEFDIGDDEVYIQIGDNYVEVQKEDLVRLLRAIEY